MNILINVSNIKIGGAVQVADSLCRCLVNYPNHSFYVVLSSALVGLSSNLAKSLNVHVSIYDIKNNFLTIILGRDTFLDNLVSKKNIDVVFTIFGPSRWEPKCKHLCGFATAQLVQSDSPYITDVLSFWEKIKFKIYYRILKYYYTRTCSHFYTENPQITSAIKSIFKTDDVYTVTNYYNQVFDDQSLWKSYSLPKFNGVTLLTVTAPYPHKNLRLAIDVARIMAEKYSVLDFRFVFTIAKEDFGEIPENLARYFLFIGKVDISECPSLYLQSDIMFQPTLMECFSATYAEAMRMEVPIVTTDLNFAHGLCGNAALYYSALSAKDCAEKIVELMNNKELKNQLIERGKEQLKHFDNYVKRADKIINILETI